MKHGEAETEVTSRNEVGEEEKEDEMEASQSSSEESWPPQKKKFGKAFGLVDEDNILPSKKRQSRRSVNMADVSSGTDTAASSSDSAG